MQPTVENLQQYLLGPIVNQWLARFNAARQAKERFDVMAKLCRQFLGSSAKAMWEDSFRREFYPQVSQPQFMVSLNKAFELVAIIGPSLYWENPVREVHSPDTPDQTAIAQLFGLNDPQMLEQIQAEQEMQNHQRQIRNTLIALTMEYMTRQHPGGVQTDIQCAIQDALVTGRGCMWTETVTDRTDGSQTVASFFDPVDNLLIDPDARDPRLRDVKWIARRHVEPIWQVERRFGYQPGYLKGKGTHISAEWMQKLQTATVQDGKPDMYHDQMEWYEIWSCGGIGARVTGINVEAGQALDQLTGDYCYLCVAQGVAHPLNLPPALVQHGMPQDIQAALKWRTSRFGSVFELWRDRRWPVEVLDFYPVVGSCWPMAVLGPGIGALLAMNLLLVTHLEMSWDRRRDIIASYEHTAAEIAAALKGEQNPAFIKISAATDKAVNDCVAFIQRPEVQGNLLEWITFLDQQFKMATGLDDIHYGISQKQARVTSDVEAKQSAANVRPDKMAKDVHQWVVNIGTKETWLAMQYVQGGQLSGILGTWGSLAWDTMVKSIPFEVAVKEVECWIDATDIAKPNRDKDLKDLETIGQWLLPVLQQYAMTTGDPNPLNGFLAKYAEAKQIRDPSSLLMGNWAPPPDPAIQQAQQQQLQLDAEQTAAQTEEIRAKTVGRLIDAQFKAGGASAQQRQKMTWDQLFNAQKMRMQDEAHLQKMVHLQEQQDIKAEAASKQPKGGK